MCELTECGREFQETFKAFPAPAPNTRVATRCRDNLGGTLNAFEEILGLEMEDSEVMFDAENHSGEDD